MVVLVLGVFTLYGQCGYQPSMRTNHERALSPPITNIDKSRHLSSCLLHSSLDHVSLLCLGVLYRLSIERSGVVLIPLSFPPRQCAAPRKPLDGRICLEGTLIPGYCVPIPSGWRKAKGVFPMSHDLDRTRGIWALAYLGEIPWHKLGFDMSVIPAAERTPEEWARRSQTNFTVSRHALTYVNPLTGKTEEYPDRFAHLRDDTAGVVGMGSNEYKFVQSGDLIDMLAKYAAADPRFAFTTVGSLNGGKRVWAQLSYENGMIVGGDKHQANLIASTSFDTGSSTIGKCGFIRVVCANTHAGMMGEHTPMIRIRHTATFNAEKARADLAEIAKGFDSFKVMGDSMSRVTLTRTEIAEFVRQMLDIPAEAKPADVSTRKLNQRSAILGALGQTANERNQTPDTIDMFSMFQAVTRYGDHTRDPENIENQLFGSGQTLKNKAVENLMERMAEKLKDISAPVYATTAPVALPASMAALI